MENKGFMPPQGRPELPFDQHRPKGRAMPRETKSQKAQVEGGHSIPPNNDLHMGMSHKTGAKAKDNRWNRERKSGIAAKVPRLTANQEAQGYGVKLEKAGKGIVLSGVVDTLADKEKFGRIVQQKVSHVENDLTISTDGQITSKEVAQEASEELQQAGVDLKHIGAKATKKGKVILVGRAYSKDEERRARRAAARARGVTGVVSQLEDATHKPLTLEGIFHSQVNNDGDSNPRATQ